MTDSSFVTNYFNEARMRQQVEAGKHREVIGGLWDEVGQMQFDILRARGLSPSSYVIDIGCGSFRAGVRLIPFLNPVRYFGIDASEAIVEAGYEREIDAAGLSGRFPRSSVYVDREFDVSRFGRRFDFGMAQSVFSHLPIAFLDRCLTAVAPYFNPGAQFLVTYFQADDDAWTDECLHHPGGVTTYPDKDPYHYSPTSLDELAQSQPSWRLENVGDWDHPRAQRLLVWHKVDDRSADQ